MRMDDQGESENVEDVRGSGGGFRPIHGIGLGTIAIALIGGWIFGVNPLQILGLLSGDNSSTAQSGPAQPLQGSSANDPQVKFVSRCFEDRDGLDRRLSRARGKLPRSEAASVSRQLSDRVRSGRGRRRALLSPAGSDRLSRFRIL